MANVASIGPRARPFVAAFAACGLAFAAVASCAGSEQGGILYPGSSDAAIVPPGGGGVVPLDGGDGGGGDAGHPDGGDGGDGGCADAGPIAHVLDNCAGGVPGNAIFQQTGCNATLTWTSTCTGVVSGASDAFDGGCALSGQPAPVPCTGPALPGTLTCVPRTGSACTIQFSP